MSVSYPCPQCQCENTYPDMNLWICPECFYEWDPTAVAATEAPTAAGAQVVDSNGNALSNGDAITVIKDLKVKGSPAGLKAGTKIKNIRIVDGDDGHNIACKVDGIGSMFLKSEFVKKA